MTLTRIVIDVDDRDLIDATELRNTDPATVTDRAHAAAIRALKARQGDARKRILNAIYDAWRHPPAAAPVTAADFAPAPAGAQPEEFAF